MDTLKKAKRKALTFAIRVEDTRPDHAQVVPQGWAVFESTLPTQNLTYGLRKTFITTCVVVVAAYEAGAKARKVGGGDTAQMDYVLEVLNPHGAADGGARPVVIDNGAADGGARPAVIDNGDID